MGFASSLVSLSDGTLPASFEGLKSQIPLDWIQSCLADNGIATLRKRKLPVERMIWLVIGMGLYRNRSIPEIVSRLDLVVAGRDGKKRLVSKSAITPARDRLGSEPLRDLFCATAEHWGLPSADRHAWRGLKIFGIDGTAMRVPDSPENRKTFGLFAGSAYPVIRLAALMALRSRLILDCSFSGCRTSENTLAHELLSSIPDHSLTIMDRYYHNYSLWQKVRLSGQHRHWLVRAREDLRCWTVVERFRSGDELVEICPSEATLRKHPGLHKVILARAIRYRRAGFRTRTLLTSLLDPKKYPASEIAELYHERWELEIGYGEIKTVTLEGKETIRSKTPERVRQELWGLLIAYNLVRREIDAAAEELKLAPNRISFSATLRLMRDLFFWAEVASPGKLPKMVQEMRVDLRQFILPPRRARSYPRHVKSPQRHYGVNVGHSA